jgi:TolB-like protein
MAGPDEGVAARSNKGVELPDVLNLRYVPPADPKTSQFHLKRRGGQSVQGQRTGGGRAPPSPADIRDHLDCIFASSAFTASTLRRTLLCFLVEEAVAGRADRLKGFTIATAVFGRDETFDPQTDPVVRLEARRLRRDLDGYYATAGSGDALRISIPKGTYAPCFEWQAKDDPRRPALAAGLAIALLISGVGAWLWAEHQYQRSEEAAAEPQERGPSVIVVPFEALSTRENDRFLAVGLTQQLMADLMRFDAFQLYSAPASFGQSASDNPVELGRSPAIAYVVKGSVRSDGETVRVASQLIDAKTGQLLWGEVFDRALTPDHLLAVQESLASQIATHLGQPYGVVRNVAAEHFRMYRPRTLFAYECVLRAYTYRRTYSRELYPGTRACLQDAVRQDPDYAEGWAFLGWLRMDAVRLHLVQGDEAAAEMDRALSATSHAVELAPKNAVALQASAAVAWYRGDLEEAERLQRQALALNPHDPEILAQLGWRLAVRERWDEGLGYLSQAIDRTINPPGWYHILFAIHHYLQGNYTAALAAAERAKTDAFGIGWSLIAINQAALGNQAGASRALAEMAALSPLLARDPAAAYRIHQPTEAVAGALVAGLRKAGWKEPAAPVAAAAATGGDDRRVH